MTARTQAYSDIFDLVLSGRDRTETCTPESPDSRLALAGPPPVHHPRLFPIDLQLEFSFQPRFDKLDGLRSHLFRQRHKIIGVTHQLDIGPSCRPLRTVKQGVEPV